MKFNFLKDVPSMSEVDFDHLDLGPLDWKILSRPNSRRCQSTHRWRTTARNQVGKLAAPPGW